MAPSESPRVVIETRLGSMTVELFQQLAPKHVESFLDLAGKGFYDGTTFHRVIPGFMIQGGCPHTKSFPDDRRRHGTGGPGYNVDAEFSSTPHTRGVLSMARANDPNSAGSQFFVVVKDSRFLDNNYTAFGQVVEGMEVADAIVAQPRDDGDNPHDRVELKVRPVE